MTCALRLVLALPVVCGCTVNIYWTDYVVHGELRLGEGAPVRREPIPLELKVKDDAANRNYPKGEAP